MGEVSTSQWIQFFRNSGMPLNVAANYAIIFYDNRIQLDMLMDLSKEYLYDMGIRVMGDVIAILRHAKEYHNQMVKEKMIGGPTMPVAKRTGDTPTTRMLTHYTRPSSVTTRKSSPVVQRGIVSGPIDYSTISRRAPAQPAKRTLVNLSRPTSQGESPIKKARFFQPQQQEEEKSMVVRMPSGTTDRSRKLLQLQQQMQSVKRSVFDRLGDSHVSSSTDVKFIEGGASSVFSRLGPSSSSGEVTSTAGKVDDDDSGPLQYRGVLKKLSTVKTTRTIQKNLTLVKSAPGKKIIRLNASSSSVTASPKSLPGRRTVVQSARDLQASNVSQINKILAQNNNRTSPLASRLLKPTVGLQNYRGNRLAITNKMTAATNRINLIKKQQQLARANNVITVSGRGKVVSLKNNPTSRFAQTNRLSVFNRLGKK